jgi:tRNA (guanine37-N1)-methyltransferase
MNYHILTLFPEMVLSGLSTSILGRAEANGLITIEATNIRDFSEDKHRHVDDYPYGGGAGMVMQPDPIYKAYQHIEEKITAAGRKKPRVIYMTPQGQVFHQRLAEELAQEEDLVFLCGHYEGVDERILDEIVTDTMSIGDYVLTGGELPAMVMIDAISRMVPGVLTNEVSGEFESFHDNLLEYPQYTRPVEYHGRRVPDVLLSGHHAKIEEWRRQKSIERTLKWRPDLLDEAVLSKKEQAYLEKLRREQQKQEEQ